MRSLLLAIFLPLAPLALSQEMEYRSQPAELGSRAPRVGEWIPDLVLSDISGGEHRLSSAAGEHGTLILLRDPECPLSQKFSPEIGRVVAEYGERGVGVLLVAPDADLARKDVEEYGIEGATYVVDADQTLVRALAATTTTEAFVLDASRTLVYRGMVNDQYGLGFTRPAPQREYLREALEALLAGSKVGVPATVAQGCKLELEGAPASAATEVTYHNRISRIVQDHCMVCHRPGAAGPFPLTTYEETRKRSGMIEWVVEDGVMPPWFAGEHTGPWANDMGLTQAERDDLLAWVAADTPEGDPAHAPLPREWADGWTIGEPDLVASMPESFTVPAENYIRYQTFYTKLDTTEDHWVEAVEIRPGARPVVHHVLVWLESPEVMERIRSGDRSARALVNDGARTFFAATVPGQVGTVFPEGTGKKLPAGSWLKWQMHYTPVGKEMVDLSEIGFRFSDEPLREVRTDSAVNFRFAIPPHSFDHEVSARFRFPEEATILSFFPHTHLRGHRFRFDLISPKGEEELLLELPFYDFNWQLGYDLLSPRTVPKGTYLKATAWFDNTAENPANPDPSAWVRFGEQTFEEMMIGYVNWIPAEGR